jgi:hypothetical protein
MHVALHMKNSVYVLNEQDDLNATAALPWREQAGMFRGPVWGIVYLYLERGFPARQFSILVSLCGLSAFPSYWDAKWFKRTEDILW